MEEAQLPAFACAAGFCNLPALSGDLWLQLCSVRLRYDGNGVHAGRHLYAARPVAVKAAVLSGAHPDWHILVRRQDS